LLSLITMYKVWCLPNARILNTDVYASKLSTS